MSDVDLVFAGDLVLDEPQPDYWLDGIAPRRCARPTSRSVTSRCRTPAVAAQLRSDVPAPGADPDNVPALRARRLSRGDAGRQSHRGLRSRSVSPTRRGAGCCRHRAQRRRCRPRCRAAPCVIERPSLPHRAAQLQLCWPRGMRGQRRHARRLRLSCASKRQMARASRRAPRWSAPDAASLAQISRTTSPVRARTARLVIVALHKGIVHTPARLAPYERAVAHAAIDAGADVVDRSSRAHRARHRDSIAANRSSTASATAAW